MIAPCGINCHLCRAFYRKRNPCYGCRVETTSFHCKIKECGQYKTGDLYFCDTCSDYPCKIILHLDKRYRTQWGTSPMENMAYIRQHGMEKFLESEEKKWRCPQCGSQLSMHKWLCLQCGHARPKAD